MTVTHLSAWFMTLTMTSATNARKQGTLHAVMDARGRFTSDAQDLKIIHKVNGFATIALKNNCLKIKIKFHKKQQFPPRL